MVIYAAATFCCRHRYIVTVERERRLFVCDRCHHRAELLRLVRGSPLPRVMPFARLDAAHVDPETKTDDYSA